MLQRQRFDRDYYKPIRTDDGFSGRNNNHVEYTSKGDRYESLSPEELKEANLLMKVSDYYIIIFKE